MVDILKSDLNRSSSIPSSIPRAQHKRSKTCPIELEKISEVASSLFERPELDFSANLGHKRTQTCKELNIQGLTEEASIQVLNERSDKQDTDILETDALVPVLDNSFESPDVIQNFSTNVNQVDESLNCLDLLKDKTIWSTYQKVRNILDSKGNYYNPSKVRPEKNALTPKEYLSHLIEQRASFAKQIEPTSTLSSLAVSINSKFFNVVDFVTKKINSNYKDKLKSKANKLQSIKGALKNNYDYLEKQVKSKLQHLRNTSPTYQSLLQNKKFLDNERTLIKNQVKDLSEELVNLKEKDDTSNEEINLKEDEIKRLKYLEQMKYKLFQDVSHSLDGLDKELRNAAIFDLIKSNQIDFDKLYNKKISCETEFRVLENEIAQIKRKMTFSSDRKHTKKSKKLAELKIRFLDEAIKHVIKNPKDSYQVNDLSLRSLDDQISYFERYFKDIDCSP